MKGRIRIKEMNIAEYWKQVNENNCTALIAQINKLQKEISELKNKTQSDNQDREERSQCIIKQNGGKECATICDLCIQRYKNFLFEQESDLDINGLFRSFYSIIERKGESTNWEAIKMKVKKVLDIQHKQMHPDVYKQKSESDNQDELFKEVIDIVDVSGHNSYGYGTALKELKTKYRIEKK